ncbi:hypothetical protein [Streptomyces sp. NPDC019890]
MDDDLDQGSEGSTNRERKRYGLISTAFIAVCSAIAGGIAQAVIEKLMGS